MSGVIKINTGSGVTSITTKRELVAYNDPILRTPTPAWNFKFPPMDIFKLGNELNDSIKEHRGLGLSSPQLGLPYRIFVMGLDNQIVMFVNPYIISQSSETELQEEGCLSFPGLNLMIRRSTSIEIDYQDYNEQWHVKTFKGLTARIFAHEMDHLDGITFTQKCSRLKLEMAVKKAAKNDNFYKIKDL